MALLISWGHEPARGRPASPDPFNHVGFVRSAPRGAARIAHKLDFAAITGLCALRHLYVWWLRCAESSQRSSPLLDRLSVSILLRSVIAALAAALVVVLALGAWQSWARLAAADRIAAVADASAHMFTALHNLAVDRARTARGLVAEKPAAAMNEGLRQARAAAMPALASALSALEAIDFPGRPAATADLAERIKRLSALHEESAAAFLR